MDRTLRSRRVMSILIPREGRGACVWCISDGPPGLEVLGRVGSASRPCGSTVDMVAVTLGVFRRGRGAA